MKYVFLKSHKKNVIFSDFTHSGVSKMPIPRGDAGAPNAQETDAGTQGPGPIEPDFGFDPLEDLFWKSNFHHSSHNHIILIFRHFDWKMSVQDIKNCKK